jgi:tetratricopeptide (TPR) repeat protein
MDAEEWTQQGIEHAQNGEYTKALQAFESALELEPDYVLAWSDKGNVLQELNRPEEALDAYGKALDLDPEFVNAWYGKGNVLRTLAQPEEALHAYEKALNFKQDFHRAWNGKGNVLRELGRPKESLRAYERALDLDPECVPACFGKSAVLLDDLDRPEDALDAFEETLDLNPNHVNAWHGKGVVLSYLERYEEALRAFEVALDLDQGSARAWTGKGNMLLELDRPEEALHAFREALDLNPEHPSALHGRGIALKYLDRYEEALRAFEKVLDLDPEHVDSMSGKGVALRNLGRHSEALDAYERALNLDPEHVVTWLNRGYFLADDLDRPAAAQRSLFRALHLVDRASSIRDRWRALEEIPSILDHLRNTGGAPLLIVSLVERHGLTDVYLREPRAVGQAYEQAAPYRLLKSHFKSSPESDPEKRRKHSLLGLAAFYLGDPFLAQEHFSVVEELTELFGPFYYGQTYQEYAENEDADLIFEISREKGERILQQEDCSEDVGPKKLYYAGQLFIAGSNPQWEQARECFEHSAKEGFLPAKHMLALVLRELGEEKTDAHEQVVVSVLEEEKRRLNEQGGPGREAGFLGGARLSDLPRSPEEVSGEDESVTIEDLEQSLWHFAHAAEISDAVLHVYEWLEAQEEEKGQIPPEYAFIDFYDQPRTQHFWTLREQRIEALQERLSEEDQGVDLETLRTSLDRYPNMPGEWISRDASQIDPKRQEELLGERISKDTSDERGTKYQELITYLALKGRISARATLSLTAYLLATEPVSTAEISDKIAESTVEAAITTGGTELLEVAGVALGPFTSFSTTVASSLTAAFVTELAREWRDQRVDYPTFREEFDTKLEGQSEESYEQIMMLMEEIRERQS